MRRTPILFSDWPRLGARGKQIDETVAPFVAKRDTMQKDFKVPKTRLPTRTWLPTGTSLAPDHLVPVPPQVGAAHQHRNIKVMGA